MNILYINGHPYGKSFHAAIEHAFVKSVRSHHNVQVLALGKEQFDPVLRFGYTKRMKEDPLITKSQELVLWADHIVFAYPIWWGDAPALLKGWIERVFTPGITYSFKGFALSRLLKGKTGDLIVTSRGIRPIFWIIGNFGIGIFTRNLFLLTGIRKKRILRLGGVSFVPQLDTEKRRKAFLRRVEKRAAAL